MKHTLTKIAMLIIALTITLTTITSQQKTNYMPNKFNFADFGMQAAQDVVGAGLGLALGGINDKRQLKQQGKLQKLQIAGQKEMTSYNQAAALKMWQDTNYSAQMEQLKKAGLNPGMIYGMSGGGGTTAAVQGGNVTGAHAPTGGGEAIAMGSTMAQLGLMRAQKELLEAQRDNERSKIPVNKATVPNIEASTTGLLQGVQNAKAQQKLTEIQTQIAGVQLDFDKGSLENRKSLVNMTLSKAIEETQIMGNERLISDATVKTKINQIRAELALTILKQYQTKAATINIDQQTRESINKVAMAIQNNMREWDKQGLEMIHEAMKEGIWKGDAGEELKDMLQNILIIPRLGGKPGATPITGFHDRGK